MGMITDYLRMMIARQVYEHRLVLWLDPERHYATLIDELGLANTTVIRYQDNFFALRHYTIDRYLVGDEPPRLVIYVPRDDEVTLDALEVVATAVLLRPGQTAAARNTRLSIITRRALRDQLGAKRAEELARKVEAVQLGLADLERLDEREGGSPVITAIFGTGSSQEVGLLFLSSTRYDAQIIERQAQSELAGVLWR